MALQWYVERNGQKCGPVSSAGLKAMADAGQISPTSRLWREGFADWVEAGRVQTLFNAQAPTPPTPLPAEPAESARVVFADSAPPPLPANRDIPLSQPLATTDGVPEKNRGRDEQQAKLAQPPQVDLAASRIFSLIVTLAGLVLMLYGVFKDTTVGPEYGDRTFNIGLLTESTNLVVCGAAIFLSGIISFGVARLLQALPPQNRK